MGRGINSPALSSWVHIENSMSFPARKRFRAGVLHHTLDDLAVGGGVRALNVVAQSRALTFLKVVPIFKRACLSEPSVFVNDRAGRLERSVTLNVVHCFLDGVKVLGVRLHVLEGFLAPVIGHADLKRIIGNAELPPPASIESMVCKVAALGGLRGSGFVGDGDFD